jgi:hypothetical protein
MTSFMGIDTVDVMPLTVLLHQLGYKISTTLAIPLTESEHNNFKPSSPDLLPF